MTQNGLSGNVAKMEEPPPGSTCLRFGSKRLLLPTYQLPSCPAVTPAGNGVTSVAKGAPNTPPSIGKRLPLSLALAPVA